MGRFSGRGDTGSPAGMASYEMGTDPYARWCGRGGTARCSPIPIKGPYATFAASRRRATNTRYRKQPPRMRAAP
jgi:hypothetical protein